MKRLSFILLISVSLIGVGPLMGLASVSGKAPCCISNNHCSHGLERMPCCERSSGTTASGMIPTVEKQIPSLTFYEDTAPIKLDIACDKNPPKDEEEDLPEETSLYLLKESLLF